MTTDPEKPHFVAAEDVDWRAYCPVCWRPMYVIAGEEAHHVEEEFDGDEAASRSGEPIEAAGGPLEGGLG